MRAPEIDLANFVGQAVTSQPEAICSKSIGFDDLGTSLQVFVMDAADQVGLRKIQFVIAAVDKNSLGVEPGSHRAVA